jgi:hypothetical protein
LNRIVMCMLLIAAFLASTAAALPAELIGQASVIDRDTLEIHGTRVRLWGIYAPESAQLCRARTAGSGAEQSFVTEGDRRLSDRFSDQREGFRRRTPAPPPFSSMNSTPASSSARRIARSFAAVIDVADVISSARRIVVTPTEDDRARSSALHLIKARAARICALVSEIGVDFFILYDIFHSIMYKKVHYHATDAAT